jgi:hypothetical protein
MFYLVLISSFGTLSLGMVKKRGFRNKRKDLEEL